MERMQSNLHSKDAIDRALSVESLPRVDEDVGTKKSAVERVDMVNGLHV